MKSFNDSKREESLREACAIGNYESVAAYLNAGVNVNSQNNMNGWTALHWAVHRDFCKVARLLLEWNARSDLINTLGKTPIEYVKSEEMKTILAEQGVNVSKNTQEERSDEVAFVPNYLLFPELIPAVSTPQDSELQPQKQTTEQNQALLQQQEQQQLQLHQQEDQKIQVLIVRDSLASPDNVIGSVLCSITESFSAVLARIKDVSHILSSSSSLTLSIQFRNWTMKFQLQ